MHPFEDHSLDLNTRVRDLISRLTPEEKISFLPSRHPAIERLNLPEFHLGGEGAHGVVHREGGTATVFPQPIGLSMTWDKALLKKIGAAIGDEARVYHQKYGRNGWLVLFFPTIDMERDPRWGRNEEAYGEDPFLAGTLAVELIKGFQSEDGYYLKAAAMTKHFYANNYEFERTFTDSVIADERLKHEYYLRVFERAFRDGKVVSLMTAYNKVNGVPGILNPEMNTIVREKWGADGFFVSDGGAFGLVQTEHQTYETYAESAAAAVKAGLDNFLDKPELVIEAATEAYQRGLLTEADLDAAMLHQFSALFRLGVYGGSGGNPYSDTPEGKLCCDEHSELSRQAAREAVTLLKNDGFLPIKKESVKSIAVIGQLGDENMPDWYSGNPPYQVTVLDGVKREYPDCAVTYADGCDVVAFYTDGGWLRVDADGNVTLDGTEDTRAEFRVSDWGYGGFGIMETKTRKFLTTTTDGELRCDADAVWGWFARELFFMEGGSFLEEKAHGAAQSVGVAMRRGISVYDKPYTEEGVKKINETLRGLKTVVLKDGLAEAARTAKDVDAVVAVLGSHSLVGARECADRDTLDLPGRWNALFEACLQANSNTALALISSYPFAIGEQEKRARAVVFTSHGAQEVGRAVAETLSGINNPAGRLSQTWYKSAACLPDINDYDIVKNKMTYLYYEGEPLHEFGYGLSYTGFKYENLSLARAEDCGVSVEFDLTNTGGRDGDEVAQVYFTQPKAAIPRPVKQLAGYERVRLAAGETKRVNISIPRREFEIYDADKGRFVYVPGEYKIMVGASSKDLRLEGIIII